MNVIMWSNGITLFFMEYPDHKLERNINIVGMNTIAHFVSYNNASSVPNWGKCWNGRSVPQMYWVGEEFSHWEYVRMFVWFRHIIYGKRNLLYANGSVSDAVDDEFGSIEL